MGMLEKLEQTNMTVEGAPEDPNDFTLSDTWDRDDTCMSHCFDITA